MNNAKFKLIVCGGRDFGELYYYNKDKKRRMKKMGALLAKAKREKEFIFDTLDEYLELISEKDKPIRVINGGQYGADLTSTEWAVSKQISHREYVADWKRYGPKAGPIRNKKMLDDEMPYSHFNEPEPFRMKVLAFPGGDGTANMIEQAERAGVEVIRVEYK